MCAAALAFVAQGEAPLGIVYADRRQRRAEGQGGRQRFPDDSHPPILYPLAITAASTNPDARAFFDFMRSDEARPGLREAGLHLHRAGS